MTGNDAIELTTNERIYQDRMNGMLVSELAEKYNISEPNVKNRYRAQINANQANEDSELYGEFLLIARPLAYRLYRICINNDIYNISQLAQAINSERHIKQVGPKYRKILEELVKSKGLYTLDKIKSDRIKLYEYETEDTIDFSRLLTRKVNPGTIRPMVACNNEDLEVLSNKFSRFNTSNRVTVKCIRTSNNLVQSLNSYNMLLTKGLVFNAINIANNIIQVQIPTDEGIHYVTYAKKELESKYGLEVIGELEWTN